MYYSLSVVKYLEQYLNEKCKPQKDFSNGTKVQIFYGTEQFMIPAYKTSLVMHTFETFGGWISCKNSKF